MCKFLRFRSFTAAKQRGDVLIITLIMSAFMLMVGLALSRFLLQDLFFIKNLIDSEKAYFAAESGVEVALGRLKTNPIEDVDENIVIAGPIISHVVVDNLKEEHDFVLAPNQTKRFKISRDGNIPITQWNIEAAQTPQGSETAELGDISWRIICQKNNPTANVALSGRFPNNQPSVDFSSQQGTFDNVITDPVDPAKTIDTTDLNYSVRDYLSLPIALDEASEQETCFVNYQNLSPTTTNLNLTAPSPGLTPEQAIIKSSGQAGEREKVIYYQFQQSGLGSVFDFGVLLRD